MVSGAPGKNGKTITWKEGPVFRRMLQFWTNLPASLGEFLGDHGMPKIIYGYLSNYSGGVFRKVKNRTITRKEEKKWTRGHWSVCLERQLYVDVDLNLWPPTYCTKKDVAMHVDWSQRSRKTRSASKARHCHKSIASAKGKEKISSILL